MSAFIGATTGGARIPWLNITAQVAVPLFAALATLIWGIWTYRQQQRSKRRDGLREIFSEALRAVADYQELPYLVRRRSEGSPMKAAELTFHASSIQSRLDYFSTRLRLESRELGDTFDDLVRVVRMESGAHISEAWNEERLVADHEMPLGNKYGRERSLPAKAVCLSVMQRHLGIRPSDGEERRPN